MEKQKISSIGNCSSSQSESFLPDLFDDREKEVAGILLQLPELIAAFEEEPPAEVAAGREIPSWSCLKGMRSAIRLPPPPPPSPSSDSDSDEAIFQIEAMIGEVPLVNLPPEPSLWKIKPPTKRFSKVLNSGSGMQAFRGYSAIPRVSNDTLLKLGR